MDLVLYCRGEEEAREQVERRLEQVVVGVRGYAQGAIAQVDMLRLYSIEKRTIDC